jgi:dolichol kinase
MAFWLVSVSILTAGVLASHNLFTYRDYYYLLLLLPPVLTILENFAVLGADNIVIPLVTIAALNLFQA